MALSAELENRKKLIEQIGSNLDANFRVAAALVTESIQNSGTLFFAGNGGSAAEAQHMSAEYLATLDRHNLRPGIRSLALTVDTSFLTAWSNDFAFEQIFSRQIETLARAGDVFFAYSTSGTSPNIIHASNTAKQIGMRIVGLTGQNGSKLQNLCDVCFMVPAVETKLVQEVHTMIGHELCSKIERGLINL